MNVKIEQSWKNALSAEFNKDYFIKLTDFVRGEYLSGKAIYPDAKNIFILYISKHQKTHLRDFLTSAVLSIYMLI